MATAVVFEDQLRIPPIASLDDFRQWLRSEEFPARGRIDYVAGEIEVDLSPENLFFHGTLKGRIYATLLETVDGQQLGYLFTDRTRVTCIEAGVSAEPDIVLLSDDAIDTGRVTLVPKSSGGESQFVEIEGPPDLIVEIVSDASQKKDTERLPAAYFAAGVPEFWLVDARPAPSSLSTRLGPAKLAEARSESLLFQIYAPDKQGYQPVTADSRGLQHSAVLNKSFRLERTHNSHGRPAYTLHVAE